jgi:hypothetical protein
VRRRCLSRATQAKSVLVLFSFYPAFSLRRYQGRREWQEDCVKVRDRSRDLSQHQHSRGLREDRNREEREVKAEKRTLSDSKLENNAEN